MLLILMMIFGLLSVIAPLYVILPTFIDTPWIYISISCLYYWLYYIGVPVLTNIHPIIMIVSVFFAFSEFTLAFAIIYTILILYYLLMAFARGK